MNLTHRYMETDRQFLYSIIKRIVYSISREMAPIYTIGQPDPRSFSRGRRGIAGTMELKHPLLQEEFDRLRNIGTIKMYANSSMGGMKLVEFIDVDILSDVHQRRSVTFIAKQMRYPDESSR